MMTKCKLISIIRKLLLSGMPVFMCLSLQSCEPSKTTKTNERGGSFTIKWDGAIEFFQSEKVSKNEKMLSLAGAPILLINGKEVIVSDDEYIADKIKGKKGKYAAIPVPMG